MKEFLAIFLNILDYPDQHQLHMAAALKELFEDIKEKNQRELVPWEDVTSFFVSSLKEDSNYEQSVIPHKHKPTGKVGNRRAIETILQCKETQELAPIIIGRSQDSLHLRGISQSKHLVDSFFHQNPIKEIQYLPHLNTILSLDHLSDHIRLYNCATGRYTRNLKMKSENHSEESILISIAWSETEQRIGACCQDFSLAFWDASDNFTYEKNFSLGQDVLLVMIKYIEFCSSWIAVDQLNRIHIIDLERESCQTLKKPKYLQMLKLNRVHVPTSASKDKRKSAIVTSTQLFFEKQQKKARKSRAYLEVNPTTTLKSFSSKSDQSTSFDNLTTHVPPQSRKMQFKETVTQICQLPQLRMICVSCLNKKLTFWNLPQRTMHREILCGDVSLHSLAFSQDYNVLLTAGYQKSAGVWAFDASNDPFFEGKLEGHVSQLTALQVIKGTPLALTADETGVMKSWDIRSFNCLQTIYLDSQFALRKLIYAGPNRFVGSGKRLLWFEFEAQKTIQGPGSVNEPPIAIEFNKVEEELVIATKSDIRIIDISSGKTKKIWAHYLKDEPEGAQITHMILGARNKYLILSTSKGTVASYSYRTGKPFFVNSGHPGHDVTSLALDPLHHLLVSGATNSSIKIQSQVTQKEPQVYRYSKSAHLGQDIQRLALSSYLSLIATESEGGVIFIWDYQFLKLTGACYQGGRNDTLSLIFIEPYRILATTDDSGGIIFWDLTQDKRGFLTYPPLFRLFLDQRPLTVFTQLKHFCFRGSEYDETVQLPHQQQEYTVEQLLNSESVDQWRTFTPVENRARIKISKGGISESMRRNSKLSVISSAKRGKKMGKLAPGTGLDVIYFGDEEGNIYAYCLTPIFQKYYIKPMTRAQYTKEGYTPLKHAVLEGNGVFSTQEQLVNLLDARILERKYHDVDMIDKLQISNARNESRKLLISEQKSRGDSQFSPASGSTSSIPATRETNLLVSVERAGRLNTHKSQIMTQAREKKKDLEDIDMLPIEEERMDHLIKFKAHDSQIIMLKAFRLPYLRLMSCCIDSRVIKIWTLVGTQMASLNIDMPLPYKWDLQMDNKVMRLQKLKETYHILKSLFERILFERELNSCGGNIEALMMKMGVSKRFSHQASAKPKIGGVRRLAETLRICGMHISEKDAMKAEPSLKNEEADWEIEEGHSEGESDKSRVFKTEVKNQEEQPHLSQIYNLQNKGKQSSTTITKTSNKRKKDFKTMHDLLVHANQEQKKLKKIDSKMTLKQMDVRQKVILREEKEESEHKHISKAIYNLKKNAQSNEEESAKRGSLIDCVYDKIVVMLNPPEKYHRSVHPLQKELEKELRKKTAYHQYASPNATKTSGYFQHTSSPKFRRSPTLRKNTSALLDEINSDKKRIRKDSSAMQIPTISQLPPASYRSLKRKDSNSSFITRTNTQKSQEKGNLSSGISMKFAKEKGEKKSQSKQNQGKKGGKELMITEDDEIGLQGRTQCSQSPLTSIKEEPKQKLSKGYFVSTRPSIDLASKIIENEFGLDKNLIDSRLKRSKLDWKEYGTIKEMKRGSLKIPELKLPHSKEEAPVDAQAFITETRHSPLRRPPSHGSLIFQRKYSHPTLPSSGLGKIPTCREMLQQLDKKRLSSKIWNLRSRSPSPDLTNYRLLSPVMSANASTAEQPKKVVAFSKEMKKSKSVKSLGKRKQSIKLAKEPENVEQQSESRGPTKNTYRDNLGFIIDQDPTQSEEAIQSVLKKQQRSSKKSYNRLSPGHATNYSTGRSLLSQCKVSRTLLGSPLGNLFTPKNF